MAARVTAKKRDQMATLQSGFRTSRSFALSYKSHQRLAEIVAEGEGQVAERTRLSSCTSRQAGNGIPTGSW